MSNQTKNIRYPIGNVYIKEELKSTVHRLEWDSNSRCFYAIGNGKEEHAINLANCFGTRIASSSSITCPDKLKKIIDSHHFRVTQNCQGEYTLHTVLHAKGGGLSQSSPEKKEKAFLEAKDKEEIRVSKALNIHIFDVAFQIKEMGRAGGHTALCFREGLLDGITISLTDQTVEAHQQFNAIINSSNDMVNFQAYSIAKLQEKLSRAGTFDQKSNNALGFAGIDSNKGALDRIFGVLQSITKLLDHLPAKFIPQKAHKELENAKLSLIELGTINSLAELAPKLPAIAAAAEDVIWRATSELASLKTKVSLPSTVVSFLDFLVPLGAAAASYVAGVCLVEPLVENQLKRNGMQEEKAEFIAGKGIFIAAGATLAGGIIFDVFPPLVIAGLTGYVFGKGVDLALDFKSNISLKRKGEECYQAILAQFYLKSFEDNYNSTRYETLITLDPSLKEEYERGMRIGKEIYSSNQQASWKDQIHVEINKHSKATRAKHFNGLFDIEKCLDIPAN